MDVFVISLMAYYITTAPWLENCGNPEFRKAKCVMSQDFSASVFRAALMRHLGRALN